MLACSDRIAVLNLADEYASVAYLSGVSHIQEHLHRALQELVTADDGDVHTLNHIGTIYYATVDALLTALSDAVAVMILKPVDVGSQKCLLDLFKLCPTYDCFNLFHKSFAKK